WSPVSAIGASSARYLHSAIWMSGRMIVWGGSGVGNLNTGGRYDPVADSWSATSILAAPSPRYMHTAIPAGTFMIGWGGYDKFGTPDHELSSGGRYVPALIDNGEDSDGDGFSICTDCNDSDASVHPGAAEICDGIDNDCNGLIDEADQDGDGFRLCAG